MNSIYKFCFETVRYDDYFQPFLFLTSLISCNPASASIHLSSHSLERYIQLCVYVECVTELH